MKKLLIKIRQFFVPIAFLFIATSFSGAYYSDRVSVTNNSFTAGTWSVTATSTPSPAHIVINEFMANPDGDDDATMPNGEWIELFNSGGSSLDISGWRLYDAAGAFVPIIPANVLGGSTTISSGGYLIVFRNSYSFSLNNTTPETIGLYSGTNSDPLIDSVSYSGSIEDRTWARLPNGTGDFTNDHEPKPGGPNV